jgi:hypothetical protein
MSSEFEFPFPFLWCVVAFLHKINRVEQKGWNASTGGVREDVKKLTETYQMRERLPKQ